MATMTFDEVISLANFSRTTRIDATPLRSSQDHWSLYKAQHRVHTSTYPFHVLAIHSKATKESIRAICGEISNSQDVHVVYAPSAAARLGELRTIVPRAIKHVWTYKEYVTSFIKDELDAYLGTLSRQTPEGYVDPPVVVPAGFAKKIPNPLMNFLTDDAAYFPNGGVAILLAPPGQGKTYMARHIVGQLASRNTGPIPVMIASEQWHEMAISDLESLPKTIMHSFRHYNASIGWVEGHEDDFIRTTLRADVFRIVFDGFDEYILRNPSARAADVLETLCDLAKSTGSRLIITARKAFWEQNIADTDVESLVAAKQLWVYELSPFSPEHADNYFRQRFTGKHACAVRASIMFREMLKTADPDFVGRGFVLGMIADCVETGDVATDTIPRGPTAIKWLMTQLCEREVGRQKLPLTADEQMNALGLFACEVAAGEKPTAGTLECTLQLSKATLTSEDVRATLSKLATHPLIEKESRSDHWVFRQPQTYVLLLASNALQMTGSQLRAFARRLTVDAAVCQDVITTMVRILTQDRISGEDAVTRLVGGLRGSEGGGDSPRFVGDILLAALDALQPRGSSHLDRANCFVRMAGGSPVSHVAFSGTISRLDLRNMGFDSCRFENVTWANCTFDESSQFTRCTFAGGDTPRHCTAMGTAVFDRCLLDTEAERVFNALKVLEGTRAYGRQDLKDDMTAVLAKFAVKGGWAFRTVTQANLGKGSISASRHRAEILECLKDHVLAQHSVSGVSDFAFGIHPEAEESMRFFVSNNVFTGPLLLAFDKLVKKLRI